MLAIGMSAANPEREQVTKVNRIAMMAADVTAMVGKISKLFRVDSIE